MEDTNKIKQYIIKFKEWFYQKRGNSEEWEKSRQERHKWYQEKLSLETIDNLTEEDFSKLIKDLWASNIFKNKDYKVQYLIQNNGFDKIKKKLKELLYGDASIGKRWDDFKVSIKGLGPSSISEILSFFNPQEYALINLKIYKVLPRLDIPINGVKSGRDYEEAIQKLEIIRTALKENGFEDADFIMTDFFIAYLFYEVFKLERERKKKNKMKNKEYDNTLFEEQNIQIKNKVEKKNDNFVPDEIKIDSHEKAELTLLLLGNLLGYDTYTPDRSKEAEGNILSNIATLKELPYFGSDKIMESASNIDVVWVKDEWPEYFFEVEHTTGITPGLLRIYRVAPKISAKCFIISSSANLSKFKREIEKPPFKEMKDRYKFKSYEELEKIYSITKQFIQTKDSFFEE